ncbi:hypothetical protein Cgig2_033816 [Carnegiea gigantea]|uniref:SWIM-type domain-containing protein n=1 Tax=Carnegiea gigantea TaxID=171969 RepID=A0A9Q1QEM1_9CARY|nr:hypothetical protein Cgig2_033816 [Carnegiea gigantea]
MSPTVTLVKPVAHRPVTRSVANSPVKPTPSSQSRPCESPPQPKSTSLKKSCKYPAKPTSTSSPKPTAKASPPVELKVKGKSSYYLLISPSPSPQSKADCTPLQSTVKSTLEHSSPLQSTPDVQLPSYPSRPQTRSCLKKPDSTPLESTPNPSKPDSNPKHSSRTLSKPNCNLGEPIAAPSKPHTRSQTRDDGIHTCPNSVRLKDKFCDCRKWQLTGLPCKHAARCIFRMKQQLEDYVEDCFTVEKYKNLYNHIVHPIVAPQMWEKRNLPNLDPPYAQRKISRPLKHKRRESLNAPLPESQSQQLPHKVLRFGTTRCKTCEHLGHNAATYGRPRDEHGRLLTKRKRRPIEGRVPKPWGRPKKQKAATLTPPPSTTVVAQAGPSTQCSQVGATQAT